MKLSAISLWQPWASLLFATQPGGDAVKVHETRNYPPPKGYVGQRIAVHAAKQPIVVRNLAPELQRLCLTHLGEDYATALPMGAYVGTAVLAGAMMIGHHGGYARPESPEDALCGWWEPGRWAWRLQGARALAQPVPAVGKQGWWTVDLETI